MTAALIAAPGPASAADSLTITTRFGAFPGRTANQGWWPNIIYTTTPLRHNINDPTALLGTHDEVETVDFFTFNLKAITRPVTSVVLRIPTGNQAGIHSHFQLHDVSTAAEQLNKTTGYSQAIAHDLTSGELYGGTDVTNARDGSTVLVQLNAAGIAAVNAARGGYFSLGGRLWPRRAILEEHFMFNSGSQDPAASLRLTFG